MSPSSEPDPSDLSLVARLRRRYGEGIDPGVTLGGEPEALAPSVGREPLTPAAGKASTGGVRQRLELRGPLLTRYRVDAEIARGGMGAILSVWDEDLRRRLAMKVALGRGEPGSGEEIDARILARFLEEAQVTGQLDHPGIVPVHELGLDESGNVFFTMRLVRGRDLEHVFRLASEEREGWNRTRVLGVLLKACEALAYAHAKGVVHRDLKPANVMVGSFGEVYVMDWGLARVLGHEERHGPAPSARHGEAPVVTDRREDSSGISGEELYTMTGDVLGTPSYMAPEQARGELDSLDGRADVYAMGAMFYRLLAGTAPYVARGETRGALAILESLLAGPPASLAGLAPEAPAALVAIAEKAMARERDERYPDMLALAEDLRAFLEDRVVGAHQSGALAEARMWIRRNRALAASLGAGVLALAGGLVASLILKGKADDNAVLARREARIAAEVNGFLNNDLLAAVAPENEGIDVTVREVLEAAAKRLDGLFPNEPRVEAQLRKTIGISFQRLGRYEPARLHLERAVELLTDAGGAEEDETQELRAEVADTWSLLGRNAEAVALYEVLITRARTRFGGDSKQVFSLRSDLALALSRMGRFQDSLSLYEGLLADERRVLGPEDKETVTTLNNLGTLCREVGRFEESEEALRQALELRRRSDGPRSRPALETLNNLSLVTSDLGRFEESEAQLREALGIGREILGEGHPETVRMLSSLGILELKQGRTADATRDLEQALALQRTGLGDEHPDTLLVKSNLAVALSYSGRDRESLRLNEEVLEVRRRVLGPEHPATLTSLNGVAMQHLALGDLEQAEAGLREALAGEREALGPDHPTTLETLENLGNVRYSRGDYDEAEALVLEVLAGRERTFGAGHPAVLRTTFNLGMLQKARGAIPEAVELLEQALQGGRDLGEDGNELVLMAAPELASLRFRDKRLAEAAELLGEVVAIERKLGAGETELGGRLHVQGTVLRRAEDPRAVEVLAEALALRRRALGDEHPDTLLTLFELASALMEAERYEEAEPLAAELHERRLEVLGEAHPDTLLARRLLAELYTSWGRPEEAEAFR